MGARQSRSATQRLVPFSVSEYRQIACCFAVVARLSANEAGHIPSWRESCESYALSLVAAGSRLVAAVAVTVAVSGETEEGCAIKVPGPAGRVPDSGSPGGSVFPGLSRHGS